LESVSVRIVVYLAQQNEGRCHERTDQAFMGDEACLLSRPDFADKRMIT
jgi:hypothetical protein